MRKVTKFYWSGQFQFSMQMFNCLIVMNINQELQH